MTARIIQGFFVGGFRLAPNTQRARASMQNDGPALRRDAPVKPTQPANRPSVVQRFGGDGSFAVDPARVGLVRSGGAPLPGPLLAKMEAAFGADFSAVRIHVGPQASRIGALAFTTGSDLYFAPGQYQPDSVKGQQLIGHELAHVIQQRQGRVRAPGGGVTVVQDRSLEAEADRLGMKAAAHRGTVQAKAATGAVAVQRRTATSATAAGPGRTRIAAGGKGSLIAHLGSGASMTVTDLEVGRAHREKGVGRALLADAARVGLRSGKSSVSLSAQDNGSGRLTRWYKEMGFRQVGVNERGFPELVAPIGRLIGMAAQAKMPTLAPGGGARAAAPDPCRVGVRTAPGNPGARPIQRAMAVVANRAQDPGQATFLTATNMTTEVLLCENLASAGGAHSEDRLIDNVLPAAAAAGQLDPVNDNHLFIGINRSPCTSTDHCGNGHPSSSKPMGAAGCAERLIALVTHGMMHGGVNYTFRIALSPRGLYGSNSDERANSAEALQAMIATGRITSDQQRTATSTRFMDTTTAKKL